MPNVRALTAGSLLALAALHGCTSSKITAHAEQKPEAASPPLVAAARAQIGVTTTYDSGYVPITYPLGDVPAQTGVCCDVVIRAVRTALNRDLQKEVHEDMASRFGKYPKTWGLTKPDPNIDHRRVPNLETYFRLRGYEVKPIKNSYRFLPGDLVTTRLPGNRPHIGIVSDRTGPSGHWMVIHNIGAGTQEEDCLLEFPIAGQFRVPPARVKSAKRGIRTTR